MKFFSFIFAFYLLSISVTPCNDAHEGSNNSITSVAQAQDHHETHNDICSPFCSCACCQVVITLTSFSNISPPHSLGKLNLAFYSKKYFSSAAPAIWQPPKIA